MRALALAAVAALAGCASHDNPAIGKLDSAETWCSAALIRSDAILTASHCFAKTPASSFTFIAGDGSTSRAHGIIAEGGKVPSGKTNAGLAMYDWAIVSIEPMAVAPLPVDAMTALEIRTAIADGASMGCALLDFDRLAFTTTCRIRHGDSGSPVILTHNGTARIIGVNIGFDDVSALAVSALAFKVELP